MKLSVVFWNNHSDSCLEDILNDDIAQSVVVYEAKSFTQVLELLEEHPTIEMLLTTLHPTDLQTLCNFQQLQQRYPDVALVAIIDTMLRVPNVINMLRRLVRRAEGEKSNLDLNKPLEDTYDNLPLESPQRMPDAFNLGTTYHQANSQTLLTESSLRASDDTHMGESTPYKNSNEIEQQTSLHSNDFHDSASLQEQSPYFSHSDPGLDPRCHLTPRQVDVLYLLMRGKSNKEIARILDLSEGTVKIHCMAIFRELGVNNRTQAAMRAEQLLPKLQSGWSRVAVNQGL